MKFLKWFFTSLLVLPLIGCLHSQTMTNERIPLIGKKLYYVDNLLKEDKYKIYDNGKTINVNLPKTDSAFYSIYSFYGDSNYLLARLDKLYDCCWDLPTSNRQRYHSIVVIDTIGNIILDLYIEDTCCAIEYLTVSRDTNIAFIKTDRSEKKPYNSFYWSDLVVYNVKLNNILTTYSKMGPSANVILNPNQAWSRDNKKLLIAISDANIHKPLKGVTDEFYDFVSKNDGLHILDIRTDEKILVTRNSYNGIWSPIDNKIAYSIGNDIYIYNVDSNSHKILFKNSANKEIFIYNLLWSPDGQYILVWFKDPRTFSKNKYFSKLFSFKDNMMHDVEGPAYPLIWK